MLLSVVAVPDTGRDGLGALLVAAVRPAFAGEIIRVDPDDPVFGRGRCGVDGCARTSWARQLCAAHHQRWSKHGKPEVGHFRETTEPIAIRAGSDMVDALDLSMLAARSRLEIAYILQSRHDDRSVRVPPSTIRHIVGLYADSGAHSLLERPVEVWLDAVRARGWKDPTRTIALLRYAYRHLADLAGIDVDAEYASDIWIAARLGIHVTRSPNQTRRHPQAAGSPAADASPSTSLRTPLAPGATTPPPRPAPDEPPRPDPWIATLHSASLNPDWNRCHIVQQIQPNGWMIVVTRHEANMSCVTVPAQATSTTSQVLVPEASRTSANDAPDATPAG